MDPNPDFECRIESLDLDLFSTIPTQSSKDDRTSWLAVQRALRRSNDAYTYLEIGSHLGGSIQQHIVDPKCRKIYSIDKRPLEQPDERGKIFRYEGNSTDQMHRNLRSLAPDNISKIFCFDTDAQDIDLALIEHPPDLCFIDGEHTNAAVLSDFEFCLSVSAPNAAICFHDDWIICPALREIGRRLRSRKIAFTPLKLGGVIYMIALRDCPVLRDKFIAANGHRFLLRRQFCEFADRYIPELCHPVLRPLGRLLLNLLSRNR